MKPSEKEEEYFLRQEFERKKKAEMEQVEKMAEAERAKLRQLHHMRCPKCGLELIEIDYKSVKVDKCPQCEGIWLDRGELEAVSKLESSGLERIFRLFK